MSKELADSCTSDWFLIPYPWPTLALMDSRTSDWFLISYPWPTLALMDSRTSDWFLISYPWPTLALMDSRTSDWFLISSPWPTLTLCVRHPGAVSANLSCVITPDSRTSDWFLISSPWPTLTLVSVYVILVLQGQQWMKKREAFQLKTLMLVYNATLVILSLYMFYEFLVSSWLRPGFSLICQPLEYDQPAALRLAEVCWWYYVSKLIELMDTFFFVLRKKNSQVTFLHVYHHSTMPILWWIGVRFAPGGEAYFSSSINCFVHVMMYTYYLLAALGPSMQKYLWWKKYMTKLQLMQFFAVEFHTLMAIYVDCGFPKFYQWLLMVYIFSHILLFANFYYHAYITKRDSRKHVNGSLSNGTCHHLKEQ
ncbi:very long chain fatty acid elongase 4-like [Liolophura sinensis]|uniref:very long chain fatty acid elongase 4-like n=1 Tax=Liolophura sinensis TaxID=3198878 RepID=UPI0031594F09